MNFYEIINYIYGISDFPITNIQSNNTGNKINIAILELEKLYTSYKNIFGEPKMLINIYIITGSIAEKILGNMPVNACTTIYKKNITCILTWEKNIELLKRVFIHEICHSFRLIKLSIKSDNEYIKYLNNEINWLYEEMLAISTEKKFFHYLSWENISGFEYNPQWYTLNSKFIDTNINCLNDIKKIIISNKESLNSTIYYLAYYISKMSSLDKFLNTMMSYTTNKGLNEVIKIINS